MKRVLFIALSALVLAGCKVTIENKAAMHVYNSAWQQVSVSSGAKALLKGEVIDLGTAADAIEKYNAAHTDDALFGPYLEPVPIELSPDAPIAICNSANLKRYYQAVIPRTDLVDRRAAIQGSLDGMADPDTGLLVPCTLYVDHIPPDPPTPPAPKLWVALVDVTAQIIYYSEHYASEAQALQRYRSGMVPQAEANNMGPPFWDGNGSLGDVWMAYIGETEYTFPVIEIIEE
jgi:hypothetical protein